MDELTDIYKRIEYLRNNGVKMKEIADRVDMAPSVLSALYSSVLPAYIDLLKTRTPDEALEIAYGIKGKDASVVVIPDGVSVMAVKG